MEEIIVKASQLAMPGLFAVQEPPPPPPPPNLGNTGEEIEGNPFLFRLYSYKPPCFSYFTVSAKRRGYLPLHKFDALCDY